MTLYSTPPPLQTFKHDKPTLLVCWWITLFCTTLILIRVAGRFIRSERLFREDKTAALAIIPLFLRMGCVHVILLLGTNNALFTDLTDEEIRRKSIASGLVLASRIFYAATLWILKSAILEFFRRLTIKTWTRSHEVTLHIIRGTLVATFVAVLISDLAECQPFERYWQVLPDPGGQCRQGYAQLITMAACNILTDLLLVCFPVPIILTSHMSMKRKVQLTLLFSMSLGVVATTIYRLPHILRTDGSQQTRSLLASVELLFATVAANALVLGSFVRDRGTKKKKYKHGSIAADSTDRASERRPTLNRHWGSDEDLVRDLGLGVDRELRDAVGDVEEGNKPKKPTLAPIDMRSWHFPRRRSHTGGSDDSPSRDHLISSSGSISTMTPRRVSFFEAGGLMDSEMSQSIRDSYNSSLDPLTPRGAPSPTMPASTSGFLRGSQVLLLELGGLLSSSNSRRSRSSPRGGTELQPITQHPLEPAYDHDDHPDSSPTLVDAGGLLR
ncbi:Uu.00g016790.m01.CDS01 [Anthostomella pinea]|uniref:Uu.00g016790.m01.CDS01 n=1 Tax=Anthostomella pinea TaxID=933095 RepID=A0AAI8VZN9_9PEZI|nr:Uu.00g016790.m01.CDS01 [Anthostomella pinea]